MTPPTKRLRIDSLPRLPRSREPGRKVPNRTSTLLRKAQDIWRLVSSRWWDLKIPTWYSGLFGVPDRLLRSKVSDLDDRSKALCLTVRMNYILDHPIRFGVDPRHHFFCLAARRTNVLSRSLGPLYSNGSYLEITPGYALTPSGGACHTTKKVYGRALACTLRNFVHLVGALIRPDLLSSQIEKDIPSAIRGLPFE